MAARMAFACYGLLVGCTGPQSALDPAGRDASQIGALLVWMTVGALVIWVGVTSLTGYAVHAGRQPISAAAARRLIIGAGVVFPVLVLTPLLVSGLSLLPSMLKPAPEGGVQVFVTGEMWWWRVRYVTTRGTQVDLANELRLPVGVRTNLHLRSQDVIHSLWIPALAGKMDMIPGRQNLLPLEPTRTGTFRGVCAEYCGSSHARMALPVVVEERAAFDRWLTAQAEPSRQPTQSLAVAGQKLVRSYGCGACHAIRGTSADGKVGPDLTHIGSRKSLAAGVLPNDQRGFARWLKEADVLKPGVHMPAFDMLPEAHVRALAAYLESLQ